MRPRLTTAKSHGAEKSQDGLPDVGFNGWTAHFAPCWKLECLQKLFQFYGIKLENRSKEIHSNSIQMLQAIGTVLPQVLQHCWLNILDSLPP